MLTPKQQRFVSFLAEGLSVAVAAGLAEFEAAAFSDASGYYVYILIDPRDDAPFYIGKGKGKRALAHGARERRGRSENGTKQLRLGDIRRGGKAPRVALLANGLSEPEAFAVERAAIASCRKVLTNATKGQRSAVEREAAAARNWLRQIKPFGAWRTERPRSERDEETYWSVVQGFERVAAAGPL